MQHALGLLASALPPSTVGRSLRFPLVLFLVMAFIVLFIPTTSHAAQFNVGMGPNSFIFATTTIHVGDTVTWTNTDTKPHTITSGNSQFDGGTMQPGATYSKTFILPGTYNYQSVIDTGMIGVVIATDGPVGTTVPIQTQVTTPSTSVDPTESQTKVAGLIQQLQALQQQLANNSNSNTSNSSNSNTVIGGTCPRINRSLMLGMQGDDVTQLQQFLAADSSVYPEGRVTGYFGALTQTAVQRFQKKNNIVSSGTPSTTGYGKVGPRTLAALCGGVLLSGSGGDAANDVGGVVKVTPISGAAPLRVTYQVTVNVTNSCAGVIYNLDFGDGSNQPIPSVAGVCQPQSVAISHVYQYGGLYKVTLSSGAHSTFTTVSVTGAMQPGAQPTAQVAIKITDNVFTPTNITVVPGTTVVWTNTGVVPHSVTMDDGSIDSGTLNPGQQFSVLFIKAGVLPYHCKFHGIAGSGMIGSITVQAASSNSSGSAAPSAVTVGTF